MLVRWTKYIPHSPFPKQLIYLQLKEREAFYGGAAGGGKSDALLMGALQYVDVPVYSAIIFRKSFADLELPGALIDRAHEWLGGSDAKWQVRQHTWTFPSGAKLAFGYLDHELRKYRYQSSEYQYIAFDELTQFWEPDYLYLFSRLRRATCAKHLAKPVPGCPLCEEYASLRRVPLRVRSASNPGGAGHQWVQERFKIEKDPSGKLYMGQHPTRPHIPAFLPDNFALEEASYTESLQELDPVTREQLLRGDWGVSEDGRFKQSWLKFYSTNGIAGYDQPGQFNRRATGYVVLGPDRRGKAIDIAQCRLFVVVDPAASAREGPGDDVIWRRAPSYTVIGVFLLTPCNNLVWWDNFRFRKEIPEILEKLREVNHLFRPDYIAIEADGLGIGVYQMMKRSGLPVRAIRSKSRDKLVRATDAANRMEQGQIWFPQQAGWKQALEAEILRWTGHPHEQDDQIDVLAHAARLVSDQSSMYAAFTPNHYDVPTVMRI